MTQALFILLCIFWGGLIGQTIGFRGQASSWGALNDQSLSRIGCRYIPECTLEHALSKTWSVDSEIAWRGAHCWRFDHGRLYSEHNPVAPYRLWLRLSASRFEVRIGLQKINFGSARMLRPLMWFDRMDPRDPLQLTEGVYGLLLRYFFLNNGNIWIWGLYGNPDPKGFEVFGTRKRTPEFGARVQWPVHSGEIAVTAHHRQVDTLDETEERLAFDGRWDIEIGFWLELALIHMDSHRLPENYHKMGTVGMDYTFRIGNGLYCQAEHLTLQMSERWRGPGPTRKLTALSGNYPFGMLDNMSAILYYDWDTSERYRFIRWQRNYDAWQIHLIGFWNPGRFQLIQFQSEQSLWMGKGIQCMIVYNH